MWVSWPNAQVKGCRKELLFVTRFKSKADGTGAFPVFQGELGVCVCMLKRLKFKLCIFT